MVAAYEHTPTFADVDGYAVGARAEGSVNDQWRLGLSGMRDDTGVTDHDVAGFDVLYQHSDQTFARLDVARSNGTGFGSTFSADGGLIVEEIAGTGSSGTAVKVEGEAALADLGLNQDGIIGAYAERRDAGFAALDVQVSEATGQENFWGVYADVAVSDQLSYSVSVDAYENAAGERDTNGTAQLSYAATDMLTYQVGVERQDNTGGTRPGQRTDLAAQVIYATSDDASVYVFGQATVDRSGLPENNRLGIGATAAFADGWSIGAEVSDGSLGTGGRVTLNRDSGDGNTRYVGYELDPDRDLDGIALQGRDRGRFVAGGTQVVSANVDMFGENTYDIFGRHRSLTSTYGLTYRPTDAWDFTTALEIGRVDDGDANDFDREAVTLGFAYGDSLLSAQGRVEYRQDDGLLNGIDVKSDTVLVSADAQYTLDETQRLLFHADVARSRIAQSSLIDGNYTDFVAGYALRPVEDDRLNVLARYRHLYDLYGLRDATDTDGPRQRSHVFSLDASYDVNRQWTVGGKLGYRLSEMAVDADADFVQNDAWLAVANARYHFVHNWDALLEVRQLSLVDAATSEIGVLGSVYRHVGDHLKVGVGYNFGRFSDDLTDLKRDHRGAFVNVVAKF